MFPQQEDCDMDSEEGSDPYASYPGKMFNSLEAAEKSYAKPLPEKRGFIHTKWLIAWLSHVPEEDNDPQHGLIVRHEKKFVGIISDVPHPVEPCVEIISDGHTENSDPLRFKAIDEIEKVKGNGKPWHDAESSAVLLRKLLKP